ncbi:MAG: restriction endonuclease [Acidimicrobiaceae bacterium]|nr:restriction endonuclease [Acidimicrobiaceae bacterium]
MSGIDGNLVGVLEAARRVSDNTKDQGDRFERLCKTVLTAHNGIDGTRRFRRVWMWHEPWPGKKPIDSQDTGIDLVAEQNDGSLAAIQCKFYQGEVSTSAVDSFLAASSRPEFSARVIMTTGSGFQRHGFNKLRHAHPPCEVFDTRRMSGWEVDWWELAEQAHAVTPGTPRRMHRTTWFDPRPAFTKLKEQLGRYYSSVRTRLNRMNRHESTWKRRLLKALIGLEAGVVTVLFGLAVIAAAAVVVAALAVVAIAAIAAVLAAANTKGRKRRR